MACCPMATEVWQGPVVLVLVLVLVLVPRVLCADRAEGRERDVPRAEAQLPPGDGDGRSTCAAANGRAGRGP
jgi:uncharacterized MAPEG superfamily protein